MKKNLLQLVLENAKEPLKHNTKFIAQDGDGEIYQYSKYEIFIQSSNEHRGLISLEMGCIERELATDWETPLKITQAIRKIVEIYIDESEGWQINYGVPKNSDIDYVTINGGINLYGNTVPDTRAAWVCNGVLGDIILYREQPKQSTPTPEDRAFEQLNEKLNSGEETMVGDRKLIEDELARHKILTDKLEGYLASLPEEFDYPLCFESRLTGIVVKFIELHNAVVIANDYGDGTPYKITDRPESFIEHTDKDVWKPIAFNKERGLYDKQLIWCSDDNMNGLPYLAFYNAIKDSAFSIFGHREGFNWANMTPAYVDEPWVKIAYDKLKD